MDNTCSQVHVGSGFLKNITNSASYIDFSAGRLKQMTVLLISHANQQGSLFVEQEIVLVYTKYQLHFGVYLY